MIYIYESKYKLPKKAWKYASGLVRAFKDAILTNNKADIFSMYSEWEDYCLTYNVDTEYATYYYLHPCISIYIPTN